MMGDSAAPVAGENLAEEVGVARGKEEVDVTKLCREAAKALGPNEMIHDTDFSLYGAMSALELMDAKMDKASPALESLESRMASGALPINLDSAISSAACELIGDTVKQPQTSPSQRALSVLDGMTVCEVAWHEGGSLPETLFACLYFHPAVFSAMLADLDWELPPLVMVEGVHPTMDLKVKEGEYTWKPADRALTLSVAAQCLATLRCCSIIRDVIIMADIYEEEDFYPNTFGFRLTPPVEDESLTDLLDLAQKALRERAETVGPRTSETGDADPTDADMAEECILAHLVARKELLHACLALRGAFTSKQHHRRMQALAKLRAERAQSSGDRSTGTTVKSPPGEAATGGDKEVVAAVEGLAAMSIDPSKSTDCSRKGEDNGVREGGMCGDHCCRGEDGAAENGGTSPATGCFAAGECNAPLVIEGKAITKASAGQEASSCTAVPGNAGGEVDECEDSDGRETPLRGIARCKGHLHAAATAFDSLLTLNATLLKRGSGNDDLTCPPLSTTENTAERQNSVGSTSELGSASGGFAFEPEMNRHLLGSSPHHHVHFRGNRGAGPEILRGLTREAEHACGVIECEDLSEARRHLLWFSHVPVVEGCNSAKGSHAVGTASLFARSLAAVCLYRQELMLGRFSSQPMLFVAQAMVDVGVPNAVVESPAGQAFLERVCKPVFETLRLLCLNRARQRTSLEVQLQDWRTLQAYADTVDDAFQLQHGLDKGTHKYMAKWTLSEVLGLMHRYLQVGIELQLPSLHEWPGTYWYWDYVITTKLVTETSLWETKEQLEATKLQMEEERSAARKAQAVAEAEASATVTLASTSGGGGAGKKGAKKKRRGNKKKTHAVEARTAAASGPGGGSGPGSTKEDGLAAGDSEGVPGRPVVPQKTEREMRWSARRDWETSDMMLRRCLCRGVVRLLAGLQSMGLIGEKAGQGPDFRFTTPSIVHRERYRAFQVLESPIFQTYEAFLSAVEFSDAEAPKVVDAAADCFRNAWTMASDQHRRLDPLIKQMSAAARGAAPTGSIFERSTNGTVARVIGCGGWDNEGSDLMALVKLAISNSVAATQVLREAESWRTGGSSPAGSSDRRKARARLNFGTHGQFPVVEITFD